MPISSSSKAPAARPRSTSAHNDIANFGFARAADVPVVVIGDIHRGGVIASLVGTFAVIDPADAALIAATLVNRFQGDPTLFADGKTLHRRAHRRALPRPGPAVRRRRESCPPRTSSRSRQSPRAATAPSSSPCRVCRASPTSTTSIRCAPSPACSLIIVEPGQPLPPADLIIIPGTKATMADLAALRAERLGHRHPRPPPARRAQSSASAAATRCWGRAIADPDGHRRPAGDFGRRPRPARRHDRADAEQGAARRAARPTSRPASRSAATTCTWASRPARDTGAPVRHRRRRGRGRDQRRRPRDGHLSPRPFRRRWLPRARSSSRSARRAPARPRTRPSIEDTLDALAAHLEATPRSRRAARAGAGAGLMQALLAPLALLIERLVGYPPALIKVIRPSGDLDGGADRAARAPAQPSRRPAARAPRRRHR